ncbi:hypothetical protein M0802_016512, partial [Mischocyttarus mexicanus]
EEEGYEEEDDDEDEDEDEDEEEKELVEEELVEEKLEEGSLLEEQEQLEIASAYLDVQQPMGEIPRKIKYEEEEEEEEEQQMLDNVEDEEEEIDVVNFEKSSRISQELFRNQQLKHQYDYLGNIQNIQQQQTQHVQPNSRGRKPKTATTTTTHAPKPRGRPPGGGGSDKRKRKVPPNNDTAIDNKRKCRRNTQRRKTKNNNNFTKSSSEDEVDTEKRSIHNNMERQRRVELRFHFDDLRKLVPAVEGKVKAAKVTILNQATIYCKQLQHERICKKSLASKLRKEQSRLRDRLKFLRSEIAHNRSMIAD